MKKKVAKKRTSTRATKSSSGVLIRFVSVSLGALFVAFIGITAMHNASTSVLGTNTKAKLLADQGEGGPDGATQVNVPTGAVQPTPAQGDSTGKLSSDTQQGPTPHSLDGFNTTLPKTNPAMKDGQDGGTITLTGNKADGEGQSKSLDKINAALKEKHVEVSSNSAHGFTIKSGDTEAETHFPLSVNQTTGALSVTTPAGTKTVTVLPNQAVHNLLQKKIISKVSSSSGQTTSGKQVQTVALTQVNNQPAFAVQGVSDKKLFGIVPVSLSKTVYVSAQTGQVLKTKESFINQILNALSL